MCIKSEGLYHNSTSDHRRQSCGFGGRDPSRFLAGRSWGSQGVVDGGRGRVSENTIAYFAHKYFIKRLFIRKREKLAKNHPIQNLAPNLFPILKNFGFRPLFLPQLTLIR